VIILLKVEKILRKLQAQFREVRKIETQIK